MTELKWRIKENAGGFKTDVNISETIGLNLPKLKKVDDGKVSIPDLKLPKLKKLTKEPA